MTDTTERGETLDALLAKCRAAGWLVRFERDLDGCEVRLTSPSKGWLVLGTGYTPHAALNAAIDAAAAAGHTIGGTAK